MKAKGAAKPAAKAPAKKAAAPVEESSEEDESDEDEDVRPYQLSPNAVCHALVVCICIRVLHRSAMSADLLGRFAR